MKKTLQSQIEQGLSYMIIGIIYKFQMNFLMGTEVIEWKPNVGCTEHTGETDGYTDITVPCCVPYFFW